MNSANELSFERSIGGTVRRSNCSFCVVCSKQVDLLTFDHAAELFHTDLQDIEFLAKQGDIHQIHNRKGQIMVCSPSLFECFEKRRTRLLDSGIIQEVAAKRSA
jgi:hypothetical protein